MSSNGLGCAEQILHSFDSPVELQQKVDAAVLKEHVFTQTVTHSLQVLATTRRQKLWNRHSATVTIKGCLLGS
jgi:hypothetical protein